MDIKRKDRFNLEKNGLFIGLLIPFVAIIILYFYFSPGSFGLFLKQTFVYGIHNKIIGLTIVPNFVMYFIFRWKTKFKVAEGISIATLIYLIFIVILKYAT